MEQYLRSYVSYQQDDWTDWLPLAEFTSNNHCFETTQMSPFMANYGYDPRFTENLALPPYTSQQQDTNALITRLSEIHDHLQAEMGLAQSRQETNANARRVPAPMYQVGDEVWLSARYIQTTRPSRKLDWKCLKRFKIKSIISPYAYELELSASMKIHPVFHVSRLEPCAIDPLPGHVPPPAPPVIVDGGEEWEVDDLLDSRFRYSRLQYLVKWKGYNVPMWEYSENLTNVPLLLVRFHNLYPVKPGLVGVLTELEPKERTTFTALPVPPRLPPRRLRNRIII